MIDIVSNVANLAEKIFPVVSSQDVKKVRDSLNCMIPDVNGKSPFFHDPALSCYMSDKGNEELFLSQGDVLFDLPFLSISDDGKFYSFKSDGMVLSNTCDCENNDCIVVAPFKKLNIYSEDRIRAIKENINYSYLYLPSNDPRIHDSFVDFSNVMSFSKKPLFYRISNNRTCRKYSLNTIGSYILMIKLSIFLCRPEDCYVKTARC